MKLTTKDLANLAKAGAALTLAGVTIWSAVKKVKDDEKREKELKEAKELKKAGRDIPVEIREASVLNERLDVSQRADAKRVLEYYYKKAFNAKTVEKLDKYFDILDRYLEASKMEDRSVFLTYIKIEMDDYNERIKREELIAERSAEKEKYEVIAKAIRNVSSAMGSSIGNSLSGVTLQIGEIVKESKNED